MSWRDNLRPASFGGVRFHTRDRKDAGGHRIKNHEYPKRDINFPEEMGRATRKWSVDAYLVGDDYMSGRDALIRACKRHGPQQYRDFWGRSGLVLCENWSVVETSHDGRFCKFSLDFINAGAGGVLPLAIPATAALLTTAASGLKAAAISAFETTFRK